MYVWYNNLYNFEMIFYLSCMPRLELDKNKSYYKTLIFKHYL